MNENFKFYLIYALAYGAILLIGEAIYRFIKSGPSWSRAFSHLAAGLISLPFPWIFSSHWWVLLLSFQSGLVLWITNRINLFPSHHEISGKSAGSYLFFVSIYLCFAASMFTGRKEFFVIPMFVLTISDPAAAMVGRKFGKRPIMKNKTSPGTLKTWAGSIAFFVTALPVLIVSFYSFSPYNLYRAAPWILVIALLSSATEAWSPYGTDNFFVPFIILIIMQLSMLL